MKNKASIKVQDLREDYRAGELLVEDVFPNPFLQFEKWFTEAVNAEISEPNAMILSTATPKGKPYSRTVLLKGYDAKGFVFYTNYESKKGKQLLANPQVCLTFCWLDLQRQIHIYGKAEKVETSISQAYFQSRPKGSQIGAWASAQSQIIQSDRSDLEQRAKDLKEQYKDAEQLPLPPHWGGFRVVAEEYEFWQGRTSRLHDRINYQKENDAWKIIRLAP